MIAAKDALLLPSAQLSPSEREGAALIECQIEGLIRSHMERAGLLGIVLKETRPNVIAEVSLRLRRLGYLPQFRPAYNQKGKQNEHTGWRLDLNPSDEAYREADAQVSAQDTKGPN